jgi:hypothetical protein
MEMQQNTGSVRRNRTTVLIVVLLGALILASAVYAAMRLSDNGQTAARESRGAVGEQQRSAAIADCNQFAAQARRDTRRIVRDGAVGGAIGAGVGAAGGAIIDGDDGIGKGAGVGALLGATAGALHGLSEENRKSEEARAAYARCMADQGY